MFKKEGKKLQQLNVSNSSEHYLHQKLFQFNLT